MSIVDALEWQAEHVRSLGAAVSGLVLDAVAGDVASQGALADVIPQDVRFGDLIGLRVMAAVHRLALERLAPRVAMHLPTLGGTPPVGTSAERTFMQAVVVTLLQHPDVLQRSLASVPQTNESGRAALLRCVLSRLDPARPIRLRELGASAGLNLRSDHLPGEPGLETGPLPSVADRMGCDRSPIDPTTQEGRITLSSYVWVDDADRFLRLGQALAVAQRVPAMLLRADAADFAEGLELRDGFTTLVWHSAFWVYLPQRTRDRIDHAMERLGQRAGAGREFVRATWEWDAEAGEEESFALSVQRWGGDAGDGVRRIVARGRSHGGDSRLVDGD